MEYSQVLPMRLFVLMTLGDDRAVRATYVAGQCVYDRDRAGDLLHLPAPHMSQTPRRDQPSQVLGPCPMASTGGRPLLLPIQAFRLAYVPVVMVYFAYGALGIIDVSRDMWIKESLGADAWPNWPASPCG